MSGGTSASYGSANTANDYTKITQFNKSSASPTQEQSKTKEEGTMLDEVVFTAKRLNWFQKAWHSVRNYINSFEVEGSIVYSVGVQAGVGIKTPIGGVGFEGNAFSVDLGSAKDIINGKDDAVFDFIGKDHWMNIRQGAGIDLIIGGASVEREMKSPTGGGSFWDKKVTHERKILGFFKKSERYQGGLQTETKPTAPSHSNGLKFGFNVQFLLGAKIDFEIRRRR